MSVDPGTWAVTMRVSPFVTERQAAAFRDALEEAFSNMLEANELKAELDLEFDPDLNT
ncbi:MAG: hypothetical protein AAFQ17_00080 [Pseudomonadota bacterium]